MNIILATDHNFVVHCATTIMSIVANNEVANFYILTDGLTDEDISILKIVANHNGSLLEVITVPMETLRKFPMPDNAGLKHISLATYYRLFIAELLPLSIKKAIYLDCDIIVRKSLKDLYEKDMTGKALGAVYQNVTSNNERAKALGFPISFGYFNAGVLLINVEFWRQNNIQSKFIDYISNHFDKIIFHDQDILNAVLYDSCMRLEAKWNMLTGMFKKDYLKMNEYDDEGNILRDHNDYKLSILEEVKDPTIVHYVSRPKAWDRKCKHPWKLEYAKYRKKAGFPLDVNYIDNLRFRICEIIRKLGFSPYISF